MALTDFLIKSLSILSIILHPTMLVVENENWLNRLYLDQNIVSVDRKFKCVCTTV